MTAWSYSSIKTFDQCPKKYYHLKVAKDVKDEGNDASIFGNDAHEAAEHFLKHGTPIPDKYAIIRPAAEAVAALKGEKHAELKLGARWASALELAPCDFFHADVWYRGIIDALSVNGRTAHMVDYKTGKSSRYADLKQLDLMAGAVFLHFPEVEVVKGGLAFVVPGEFITKEYTRDKLYTYMNVFARQLDHLDAALENGVFNPKSSPLCGWCPVESCEHWRPKRR